MVADYARRVPDLQISVEKSIEGRHVSPFGSQFAAPVELMYALAALLDFQVQHRTDDEYQLSRPRPRDPRDVTELFQIIRGSLLPGSLRRYFDLGPAIDPNRRPDTPLPAMPPPKVSEVSDGSDRSNRAMQANNIVHDYMRPGLRQAFAQSEKTASPLKFTSLDARTRDLFGLFWTLDRIMPFLLNLPLETPDYIRHFNEASLRGGWQGEEPKRTFSAMFIFHPAPGKTSMAGFRVGSKRFPN